MKLSHLTKTSHYIINITTAAAAAAAADAQLAFSRAHSCHCLRLFCRRRNFAESLAVSLLSSLAVQTVMTEAGMLLLLYRPLKITHPLTAM